MAYQQIPEINLGANVCRLIKKALYNDKPWIECYKQIASGFTKLKQASREQHKDKIEAELLQWLGKYSVDDIRDVLA